MSYRKISNLYKAQEILLFKEAWAMEKIHGCLKKGTKVLLHNGAETAIDRIKPGTKVWAWDSVCKKFCIASVDRLLIQESDHRLPWMEVVLASGRILVCTVDHPFMTDRGWVKAEALKITDNILAYPR